MRKVFRAESSEYTDMNIDPICSTLQIKEVRLTRIAARPETDGKNIYMGSEGLVTRDSLL